jgi:hypothetical protein
MAVLSHHKATGGKMRIEVETLGDSMRVIVHTDRGIADTGEFGCDSAARLVVLRELSRALDMVVSARVVPLKWSSES